MLDQYRELVADRAHAVLAYRNDYDPLGPVLSALRGRVVDVGGGPGLARHWLPETAELLVVDPESEWLDQGWEALADAFPCLSRPLAFVRGLGERLPLRDACADAVLSVFQLNHALDPPRVLREAARVLRPRGRLVLVLDDVAPRWADLAPSGSFAVRDAAQRRRLRLRWLWTCLVGASLQPEHVEVRERDVARWAEGLALVERRWRGAYLCLVYEREPAVT
jgi:SAM-dependent methyltransferase